MTISASAFRAVSNLHQERAAELSVIPSINAPQPLVTAKAASLFDLLLSEQINTSQQSAATTKSATPETTGQNGVAEIGQEASLFAVRSQLAGSSSTSARTFWVTNALSGTGDTSVSLASNGFASASVMASGLEKMSSTAASSVTAASAPDIQARQAEASAEARLPAPTSSVPATTDTGMNPAPVPEVAEPILAAAAAARVIVQQFSQTMFTDASNLVSNSTRSQSLATGNSRPQSAMANSALTNSNPLSTASNSVADSDRSVSTRSVNDGLAAAQPVQPASFVSAALKQSITNSNETNSQISVPVVTPNMGHFTHADSPASFSEKLSTTISQFVDEETRGGPTSIQLQVELPDLGTINLLISLVNKIVSLRIVAENELARKIVESQISELRQSLTNSGIECGVFEVDFDSDFRRRTSKKDLSSSRSSTRLTASNRWNETQTASSSTSRSTDVFDFVA